MQSIRNFLKKSKQILKKLLMYLKSIIEDQIIFFTIILILISFLSFAFGRLSKIQEQKIPIGFEIINLDQVKNNSVLGFNNLNKEITKNNNLEIKNFVVSKNGKSYHFPWCAGAQQISEKNKIYFTTREQAESAGYKPAKNCKGL
jgi:hypothetical protein